MPLVIGLYALGLLAAAHAQEAVAHAAPRAVACQVRSILGDRRTGGIDRRLADFPQLSRPPFSTFKRIELLASRPLTLTRLDTSSLELPNGRLLRLTYRDQVAATGRPRLRLELSIFGDPAAPKTKKPLSKTTLVMDDGDTVFHAGQPYRTGTLILAITCRAK